jgi:hypothetical protein
MPIQLIIRNPLDRDAREFFGRAGVSDAAARLQFNEFVRGIKGLGLWDSMVCWPLRSTQNAGTGTTAYSLGGLGTFNGTLVNGPVWGANGVDFDGSDDSVITNLPDQSVRSSLGAVFRLTGYTATNQSPIGSRLFSPPGGASIRSTGGFSSPATAATWSSLNWGGSPVLVLNSGSVETFDTSLFVQTTHLAVGETDATAATVKINNSVRTAATGVSTARSLGSFFKIGQQGEDGTFLSGSISFAHVHSGMLTDSQQTSLYTLYKQTLGTGLGLP